MFPLGFAVGSLHCLLYNSFFFIIIVIRFINDRSSAINGSVTPEWITMYISYWFQTLSVLGAHQFCCQSSSGPVMVNAERGYISSTVTFDTGCGSSSCPWQINAPSGQRIDIFLWDFEYRTSYLCISVIRNIHNCLYIIVKPLSICLSICMLGTAGFVKWIQKVW